MKLRIAVLTVAALGLGLFGCNNGSSGSSGGAATTGSGATATGGGASIGVKECDDWVAKMQSCVSKMDPAAKAGFQGGFDATRQGFTAAAATPAGKDQLKTQCTALLANFATTYPQCK